MAAPTVSAVGTGTPVASGNITITKPTGLTADDLMLAIFASKDNVSPSLAGWTALGSPFPSRPSATRQLDVLYRQADSGDVAASNFAFAHSGGNSMIGRIVAITAGTWDTADPFGGQVVSTADRTAPSITPDVADCLLVMAIVAADDDGAGGSDFAAYSLGGLTWTERADAGTTSGTDCQLGIATAPDPAAAATGTGSFTSTSGSVTHCGVFAVRPAPTGGGATVKQFAALGVG